MISWKKTSLASHTKIGYFHQVNHRKKKLDINHQRFEIADLPKIFRHKAEETIIDVKICLVTRNNSRSGKKRSPDLDGCFSPQTKTSLVWSERIPYISLLPIRTNAIDLIETAKAQPTPLFYFLSFFSLFLLSLRTPIVGLRKISWFVHNNWYSLTAGVGWVGRWADGRVTIG